MMQKKSLRARLTALLTSLALLFAPAAFAEEPALPDMARLTQLLDACVTALDITGASQFSAEESPADTAVALMWVLLDRGLLPDYVPVDGKITLNEEELRLLYADLFGGGGFAMPAAAPVEGVFLGEGTLIFDVSGQSDSCAGMQIMLCAGEPSSPIQQVMLELYHVSKPYGSVSETDLLGADWYGSALAELLRTENAPFGWVLTGWGTADDLSDADLGSMQDSELLSYENAAQGFGVKYPSLFSQGTISEDADGLHAVSADGQAQFDVRMTSAAQTLEEAAAQAESAGKTVTRMPEQSAFEALWEADGSVHMEVVCISGGKIVTAAYTYPASEMEVYAAFAESIKNSLTLYALSVG